MASSSTPGASQSRRPFGTPTSSVPTTGLTPFLGLPSSGTPVPPQPPSGPGRGGSTPSSSLPGAGGASGAAQSSARGGNAAAAAAASTCSCKRHCRCWSKQGIGTLMLSRHMAMPMRRVLARVCKHWTAGWHRRWSC